MTPPDASAARCPACGAYRTPVAFESADDALRAVRGRFRYRRCEFCATVFMDPQPDDATLRAAYATGYGNYAESRSFAERLAEPLARREAARVMQSADPHRPLLEVGCGSGRFLERLRAVGWQGDLAGVEYDPGTAARTAARLGLPVAAGTAETADLGEGRLGVLVLRHVIEHLRDPVGFLRRARAALAPDGLLYLATPDSRALSAKAFGRHWWGYEVPRHLVVFSRDGLRRALAVEGFAVSGEWWGYAPQMWNASLYLALDRGRGTAWAPRAAHLYNPLVSGLAVIAGAVEVAARRSTMYSVIARVG